MKSKLGSKTKRSILFALFVWFLFPASLWYFTPPKMDQQVLGQQTKDTPKVVTALVAPSPGLPVRLAIPIISVDSTIDYVGLTKDGAMDVPKTQDTVAWYQPGKRPGEIGTAVMAGHFGTWDNGRGSVFDNLNKLKTGDKINVIDEKGATITFVVRKSSSYNPNANTTEIFSSNDGKSHLNLITCKGTWSNTAASYSERLVVFTDKE